MVTVPRQEPLARAAEGYWVQARQPLASLVFIAPLLLIYEAGVLVLGPEHVRNGADAWLRQLLDLMGFGQYFLLPTLTVCILLAWHYTTRKPWRLSGRLFYGMAAESILLAVVLRIVLQVQGRLLRSALSAVAPDSDIPRVVLSVPATITSAVSYLGAGIYEELLFRLILLSLVVAVFRRFQRTQSSSVPLAVIATSLLFAGAHYVGPAGDAFHAFSFVFRFIAGLFFALLFLYRGFGIAAAAHAGYDILVGVL